jgi:hypothetical protein
MSRWKKRYRQFVLQIYTFNHNGRRFYSQSSPALSPAGQPRIIQTFISRSNSLHKAEREIAELLSHFDTLHGPDTKAFRYQNAKLLTQNYGLGNFIKAKNIRMSQPKALSNLELALEI